MNDIPISEMSIPRLRAEIVNLQHRLSIKRMKDQSELPVNRETGKAEKARNIILCYYRDGQRQYDYKQDALAELDALEKENELLKSKECLLDKIVRERLQKNPNDALAQDVKISREMYSELSKDMDKFEEALDFVGVLCVDYDGYRDAEGLKKLIVRIADVAAKKKPEDAKTIAEWEEAKAKGGE